MPRPKSKQQGKEGQSLVPASDPPRKLPSGSTPLLDAMLEIRQAPDAVERAYMARQLVQCTLPHSDPGDVRVWKRTNGALTLKVRPTEDDEGRKLYPFGSIPRLLMFWLVTEATQTKSRHIRLGNSLDAFMRVIGLNPRTGGGKRGDAKRLHVQMERLFRSIISFEDSRPGHKVWLDMQIAPEGELWWEPSRATQDNLWESWVDLGERFFEAITAAPVPVDYRALRALKRSPLALDLYAWATYTTFSVTKKGLPRTVPWEGLHAQMGGEYADIRVFRFKAKAALKKIRLVYPALNVSSEGGGLTVHPSATAITLPRPAEIEKVKPQVAEEEAPVDPIPAPVSRLTDRRSATTARKEADRVLLACGISPTDCTPALRKAVTSALVFRIESAKCSMTEAGAFAEGQLKGYRQSIPYLRYTWSFTTFFRDGHWLDPRVWPVDRKELDRVREAQIGRY